MVMTIKTVLVATFLFSLASSQITSSTYLGGNGQDMISSISRGGSSVSVVGQTQSTDFPGQNGASPFTGKQTFVSTFSDANLVNSVLFGGNGVDTINSVYYTSNSTILFVGGTTSTNLPVTANALQSTLRGGKDAFIAEITSGATPTIIYLSYFGGSSDDEAFGVSQNSEGDYVMVGLSNSADLPLTNTVTSTTFGFVLVAEGSTRITSLGFNNMIAVAGVAINGADHICIVGTTMGGYPYNVPANTTNGGIGGGLDGTVSILDSTYQMIYSTAYGGSSTDVFTSVAADEFYFYITGWTLSSNFPTQSATQSSNKGSADAVLVVYNQNGVTSASTYLGGSSDDKAYDVSVSSYGIFIVGQTNSQNFPHTNASVSHNLTAASSDAFVAGFTLSGVFAYGSYLGGSYDDRATAVSSNGLSISVSGWTLSNDFPVTVGQTTKSGSYDGFLTNLNIVLVPQNNTVTPVTTGIPSYTTGTAQGSTSSRGGAIAGIILGIFFGLLLVIGIFYALVYFFGRED